MLEAALGGPGGPRGRVEVLSSISTYVGDASALAGLRSGKSTLKKKDPKQAGQLEQVVLHPSPGDGCCSSGRLKSLQTPERAGVQARHAPGSPARSRSYGRGGGGDGNVQHRVQI